MKATTVAHRESLRHGLFAPDMLDGAGVRTKSLDAPRFNPRQTTTVPRRKAGSGSVRCSLYSHHGHRGVSSCGRFEPLPTRHIHECASPAPAADRTVSLW